MALLLVDRECRPAFYNSEAAAILNYPRKTPPLGSLQSLLPAELVDSIRYPGLETPRRHFFFRSGRRRYCVRILPMRATTDNRPCDLTGLLIQRELPGEVDVETVADEFGLTEREQETVALLTLGLTSKEIAVRMNISPNTVKTFCRIVMTKMRVNTRSGVVGKLARG